MKIFAFLLSQHWLAVPGSIPSFNNSSIALKLHFVATSNQTLPESSTKLCNHSRVQRAGFRGGGFAAGNIPIDLGKICC
jgi:hypothetical protein